MISTFSILSAVAAYTIMLIVVGLLMWNVAFMRQGGISILLALTAIAVLRLFLPIEIPITHTIRSWSLLGALQIFLRTNEQCTTIFMIAWGVGSVILVGIYIFALCHAREWRSRFIFVEDERVERIAQKLSPPCPVVISPDVEIPYVTGFIHHTIYFPVLDFPERWIELAMAHEIQHIRHHDSSIKLLFGFLMAVMWWNPFCLLFFAVLDTLLEMHVDAKVTAGMTGSERWDYGNMLKALAEQLVKDGQRPMRPLDVSSSVWYTQKILHLRFDVFLKPKPSRKMFVTSVCLILALFFASYLVVWQSAGVPTAESFEEKTGVSYHENYDGPDFGEEAKSAFIVKGTDGRYKLFANYKFIRYITEDEANSDRYNGLHIFEENRER